MEFKTGYYYLTVSGQLKFLELGEVKDPIKFFDDPFVNKWWRVEKEVDYIAMIIEVEHTVYSEIANRKALKSYGSSELH